MQNNEEFAKVMVCRCVRCGHHWNSKNDQRPHSCARCKRLNWWLPAQLKQQPGPKKPGTSPYGFDRIEIGQSVNFPWIYSECGEQNERANSNRNASLSQYARRSGRVFRRWHDIKLGLTVTRIS